MKKLLCILFTVLFVTACGKEAPAQYSYYENFVPSPLGEKISAVETGEYTDITESGNTAVLKEKLGLENPGSRESIKYRIVCTKCGQEYPRRRKCSLTEHPERYSCGKCGGKLEIR